MTEPSGPSADGLLDGAWCLCPSVALRPEPFGALAYHFGNRRLTFLRRPELVRVVTDLADQPDARSALLAAGVPEAHWGAYAQALARLASADVIRRRPPREVTHDTDRRTTGRRHAGR